MSAYIFHRGDPVVWVVEPSGHSAVHLYRDNGQTFCSRALPADELIIPRHARYRACGVCERMHARAEALRKADVQRAS